MDSKKGARYWKIKNRSLSEADILIYQQIGEDFWGDGLSAKTFADDLKALGDVSRLNIFINSPGGSVFDGLAIYNQLVRHKAEKIVTIDGLAASIASVIAMSGNKIKMPNNATFMIHDPFAMVIGTSEDMRKMAESLDTIKDGLINAYQTKASELSTEDIWELMSDETWMSAQEAFDYGFIDEVTEAVKIAASAGGFDLNKFTKVPEQIKALFKMPIVRAPAASAAARKIKTEVKNIMNCPKCGSPLLEDKCPHCEMKDAQELAKSQVKAAELERAKNLRAIGKEFKCETLAEYAISEDWSAEDLRTEILNRIKNKKPGEGPMISIEPAHGGKPFKNFGEQLTAIIKSSAKGATVDKRLREVQDAASGANEGVDSDGGFLIQEDFTLELLNKAEETEVLAPKCFKIPLTGNRISAPVVDETSRATGSRWGGVQVYRAAEAATVTAKKPKFAKLEMKLEKLFGLFYATDELLEDSSALGTIVGRAFTEELAFRVDDEILRGSGTGEMQGILNAPALVSQAKETGQLAATIQAENIMKMYSRMPARLILGAEWYINQEIWPQLFEMQLTIGTGGVPLFTPPGGLSVAPYGTLLGRPIVPIEQASALGTVGDIIFANLNQYSIIEKGGIVPSQSIHVRFIYDEQTFKWVVRNNGQPIWKSALTPYKGSATQSPYIALATRS